MLHATTGALRKMPFGGMAFFSRAARLFRAGCANGPRNHREVIVAGPGPSLRMTLLNYVLENYSKEFLLTNHYAQQ
jgi:hypothetical protein